jgi:hypothetical protein
MTAAQLARASGEHRSSSLCVYGVTQSASVARNYQGVLHAKSAPFVRWPQRSVSRTSVPTRHARSARAFSVSSWR